MNFDKLQKQLSKQFGSKVQVSQDEYSRVLTGSLDKWADIVACGMLAVDETKQKYVVNDIALEGVAIPKIRVPKLNDNVLDGTLILRYIVLLFYIFLLQNHHFKYLTSNTLPSFSADFRVILPLPFSTIIFAKLSPTPKLSSLEFSSL